MKPSELQEKTCHQFDCAIKTVIRHRAIDFYRAIRRSEKKEMPFAEIMDDLLNSIGTEDTYSTDYVAVFEVCGEKVSIEDEQLARALKAIEERKRNIVLQYFFIGDTDTYIGKMLDCSRANVTKCRIQALLWNFHHSSDTHPKWHMQSDHTICPDVLLLLLLLYKIFSYEFPLFHAKKAGYLPFHGNTSCQLSYYFHFFIIINLSKEKLPR